MESVQLFANSPSNYSIQIAIFVRIVSAEPSSNRIFIDYSELPNSRHAKGMEFVSLMRSCEIPITQESPSLTQHQAQTLMAVGERLINEDLAPFIHTDGMPTSAAIQRYKRVKLDGAVELLKEKLVEVGEAYRRIFPYA